MNNIKEEIFASKILEITNSMIESRDKMWINIIKECFGFEVSYEKLIKREVK